MFKKINILIVLVLLIGLIGNALGAWVSWDAGGGDDYWDTAANWVGDSTPAGTDGAWLGANGAQVVVDSNVTILKVTIRDDTELTIEDSGSITYESAWGGEFNVSHVAETAGKAGILNMDGGTLTWKGNICVGRDSNSNGILNMNSGDIDSTQAGSYFYIARQDGAAGKVYLDGGTIHVANLTILDSNGCLDITNGLLIVEGNDITDITAYVADGRIISHNGRGTVTFSYDSIENETSVYVDNLAVWDGSGADSYWSTAGNWTGDTVPSSGDAVFLDAARAGIDASAINLDTSQTIEKFVMLDDAVLNILDDGSLNASANWKDFYVSNDGGITNGSETATLNVNGGSINWKGNITVGNTNYSDGVLCVTSGLVESTVAGSYLFIARYDGAAGHVQIDGGSVHVPNLTIGDANGSIDITGGMLILDGNDLSTINTYISNGWITGYDGSGTLSAEYNSTSGKTTVTACSPIPDPVGWWKFDESSGTTAADSSGNGDDGTLNGTGLSWVTGYFGNALEFDGGDGNYVSIPNDVISGLGDELTICCWIYGDTTQPRGDYILNADYLKGSPEDPNISIHLWIPWANQSAAFYAPASSAGHNLVSRLACAGEYKGAWNHWAFTKNAQTGEMRVYVNGDLWDIAVGQNNSFSGLDPNLITIGGTVGGQYCYDGKIDDFRIYDSALTEAHIEEVMAGDTLKAWGPFPADECNGVDPNVELSWKTATVGGPYSHHVYLGTSYSAVNNATTASGEYKGSQTANSYDASTLSNDTIYYWRIDEANDSGTNKGDIWSFKAGSTDYSFDGSITRSVLENYLSRALIVSNLFNDQYQPDVLSMIDNIGAKYITRTSFVWSANYDGAHFINAESTVKKIHDIDQEIIVQACIYEAVYKTDVENTAIPSWVFEEYELPVVTRNFDYESMLYDSASDPCFIDLWGTDASIPDMSRQETQLWFYYRARSYIDAGYESLHFGQVSHMDNNDPGHTIWFDLIDRVRGYGQTHSRRDYVLCSSGSTGTVEDGDILFDHVHFASRPKEVIGEPNDAVYEVDYLDSLFTKSVTGTHPSGWQCTNGSPYISNIDRCGNSDHPGDPCHQDYWVWGWEEISWLAGQNLDFRNHWLEYGWDWIRWNDPNGYLCMPGVTERQGDTSYYANTSSSDCPDGFGQEETIKTIWQAHDEWTVLTYDDFESGMGSYTDGGDDCTWRNSYSAAHQGNYCVDIQDDSGSSSSFYHTNGIDIDTPGYTQVKIDFWFKAVSMETGEDFWLQFFDGTNWNTIATYVYDTDFDNDTFYHEAVTVLESGYTFSAGMKIRFICDASGDWDNVYIDEVKVLAK